MESLIEFEKRVLGILKTEKDQTRKYIDENFLDEVGKAYEEGKIQALEKVAISLFGIAKEINNQSKK